MKKNLRLRTYSRLNNNSGIALAVVIVIFSIVTITATTALSIAMSENKQTVNNERYYQAYYQARSAVDVVADVFTTRVGDFVVTELNDFQDLHNRKNDADPSNDPDDLEYNGKKSAMEAKRTEIRTDILPSPGDTRTVALTLGDAPNEVNCNVTITTSTSNVVEVECTVTEGDVSATAKKRIGSIVDTDESIYEAGTDFIYAWGKVDISGNNEYVDPSTVGGVIAFSEASRLKAGDNAGEGQGAESNCTPKKSMPIIYPEDITIVDKSGGTDRIINVNTNITSTTTVPHTLTSSDSGVYFNTTGSGSTSELDGNYVVDLTNGNVVIVVNQLTAKNGTTIRVKNNGTDKNNFYIFVKEKYAIGATPVQKSISAFIETKNGFTIQTINSAGVVIPDKVMTYIVAYNDTSQQYIEGHKGDTGDSKTIIPPEDIIPYTSANNKYYDKAQFGSDTNLSAHLYLPYVDVTFKSNLKLTGSLLASQANLENTLTLKYIPMEDPKFNRVGGTETLVPTFSKDWDSSAWLR